MRYTFAILLLIGCARSIQAQVVEVHGGSSTLFDSKGGEIEIKGNSYDASIGAGTIGPRLLEGAKVTKRFEGSTLTLGTESIPFTLPTDIFGGSFVTTVGGSLRTTLPSASVLLFGGMMSENFDSPFFEATRGVQPAAILLFDGRVAPTVSVASRAILAKQITMIEGIGWRPNKSAQLAASGGIGSGKGYGAVSAILKYSIFDLKTAYIETSPGFRRADVDTVLTSEPNRLNASLTVTPNRRYSVTLGHAQYLTPVAGSENDTRSTIDQVEANTELKGINFSGSIFRSIYQTGTNKALVLAASRTFGPRLRVQGTYLHSDSNQSVSGQSTSGQSTSLQNSSSQSTPNHGQTTTSLITNVAEDLTPRWSISQIVNTSNGQATFGFGTSFLSNLATVSTDYETYYVPQHLPNPFEQVLIVNADINLFGRGTLHGGTFVAPNGAVKHTVSADGVFVRNGQPPRPDERNAMERFVVVGRVVDELGQPVEGAALLIDRVSVYTDSEGNFILREHQSQYHSIQVLGKQFLEGGEYMVINSAHSVRSTLSEDAVKTIIVVQRIPKTCPRGTSCKG